MYEATDRFLKDLKKRIQREFNALSVTAFDELNIVTSRKKAKDMFDRLRKYNEKSYEKIAEDAFVYALLLLGDESLQSKAKKKGFAPKKMVQTVLKSYNGVTGYLYYPEAERKQLRLVEEMMTARTFRDRPSYRKIINATANVWYTQSMQYAITIEDETLLKVWRDAGIKEAMWVSERDSRVCDECGALDGKVFPIDKFPQKPHYGCRCRRIPITGGKR